MYLSRKQKILMGVAAACVVTVGVGAYTISKPDTQGGFTSSAESIDKTPSHAMSLTEAVKLAVFEGADTFAEPLIIKDYESSVTGMIACMNDLLTENGIVDTGTRQSIRDTITELTEMLDEEGFIAYNDNNLLTEESKAYLANAAAYAVSSCAAGDNVEVTVDGTVLSDIISTEALEETMGIVTGDYEQAALNMVGEDGEVYDLGDMKAQLDGLQEAKAANDEDQVEVAKLALRVSAVEATVDSLLYEDASGIDVESFKEGTDQEIEALKTEVANLKGSVSKINETTTVTGTKPATYSNNGTSYATEAQYTNLASQVASLNTKVTAVVSKIAETNATDLNAAVSSVQTSLEAKDAAIKTLEKDITATESDQKILSASVNTLTGDVASLKATINTLQASGTQDLAVWKTTAATQIAALQAEVAKISTADSATNAQITTLQNSLNTLQTKVASINTNVDDDVKNLSSAVETLKNSMSTVNSAITTNNSKVQETADALDSAVTNLRNTISSNQAEQTEKNIELSNQLGVVNDAVDDAKKNLAKLQDTTYKADTEYNQGDLVTIKDGSEYNGMVYECTQDGVTGKYPPQEAAFWKLSSSQEIINQQNQALKELSQASSDMKSILAANAYDPAVGAEQGDYVYDESSGLIYVVVQTIEGGSVNAPASIYKEDGTVNEEYFRLSENAETLNNAISALTKSSQDAQTAINESIYGLEDQMNMLNASAYSAAQAYIVGDYVTGKDGLTYRAYRTLVDENGSVIHVDPVEDTKDSAEEPPKGSYWVQVISNTNDKIAAINALNEKMQNWLDANTFTGTETSYVQGDLVYEPESAMIYECIQDKTITTKDDLEDTDYFHPLEGNVPVSMNNLRASTKNLSDSIFYLQSLIKGDGSDELEIKADEIEGETFLAKIGTLWKNFLSQKDDIRLISDTLGGRITDEVTNRESATQALQSDINTKVGNVNTALTNLQTELGNSNTNNAEAIAAAKGELQTALSELNTALSGDISSLDTTTQSNIADVLNTVSALQTTLESADSGLASDLENAKTQLSSDLTAAKNTLDGQISTMNTSLVADIEAEEQAREAADAALQEQIHSAENTDLEQKADEITGATILAKFGTVWNRLTDMQKTDEWAQNITLSCTAESGERKYPIMDSTDPAHSGWKMWVIDAESIGVTIQAKTSTTPESEVMITYEGKPTEILAYDDPVVDGYIHIYTPSVPDSDLVIRTIHVQNMIPNE